MAHDELHEPGRAVLIVDDDVQTRVVVARVLEQHGYRCLQAADLAAARAALAGDRPDAVVLDIELAPDSGLDLLREIRVTHRGLPVMLVTGRGSEADRVMGFELGADDYLVKPFYPRELGARVGALLRRRRGSLGGEVLQAGRLRVDLGAREASASDVVVELTSREFDLLVALMRAGRHVRSREQLLQEVWDSSPAWQTPATVTEHVRRLRNKLAGVGVAPEAIVTVRSVGYRFDPARTA